MGCTDAAPHTRLRCVKTYNNIAGHLVADLLIQFYPARTQSHAMIPADFTLAGQLSNTRGSEKQALESGYLPEILKPSNHADLEMVKRDKNPVIASGLPVA